MVQGVPTWQEVTSLVLVNQEADESRTVNLLYLDANQNILGASRGEVFGINLSPEDLDEIHICRTLQAAGLPVPQAGLVEGYLTGGDPGGVYAWVKNLLGKFFVTIDEPFSGRVTGIAKTECRLAPPEVTTPMEIAQKFLNSGAPGDVPPIFIEETAEPEPQVCGGIAGIPCGENEVCDLRDNTCSIADLQGTCVVRPEVCPTVFDPVCGCDGVTYGNDCERLLAGATLAHSGECPP